MDEQYIDELQQAENEFNKKNYSAALNIFFELAHKNCVQAQYRLAQMYDKSNRYFFYTIGDIKENPQQAFYWYQKAAKNGRLALFDALAQKVADNPEALDTDPEIGKLSEEERKELEAEARRKIEERQRRAQERRDRAIDFLTLNGNGRSR